MFYGAVIKPGQQVSPSKDEGEILHISQACLHNPSDNSSSYLMIENGSNKYAACALSKNITPHAQLDLFVSTESGVKLSVKGNSEIHVIGYYEPQEDGMDMSDEEDEDEEDVITKMNTKKNSGMMSDGLVNGNRIGDGNKGESTKVNLPNSTNKKNFNDNNKKFITSNKNEEDDNDDVEETNNEDDGDDDDDDANDEEDHNEQDSNNGLDLEEADSDEETQVGPANDDDDGDDDNDDGIEDDEDEDDDDEDVTEGLEMSDEEDDEDEEDLPSASFPTKAKISYKSDNKNNKINMKTANITNNNKTSNKLVNGTAHNSNGNKRKLDTNNAVGNASGDKKAKNDFSAFEKELSNVLRTGGRCSFSALGAKVKKPAGVEKLGQFIKERSHLFTVENGFISLKK